MEVHVPDAGHRGRGSRPHSLLGSEPEKRVLTAKKETALGALSSALQTRRLWRMHSGGELRSKVPTHEGGDMTLRDVACSSLASSKPLGQLLPNTTSGEAVPQRMGFPSLSANILGISSFLCPCPPIPNTHTWLIGGTSGAHHSRHRKCPPIAP